MRCILELLPKGIVDKLMLRPRPPEIPAAAGSSDIMQSLMQGGHV